jgi:uncharacterized protein YndB with AHSA1/START domain
VHLEATRQLIASLEDVWALLAEPHHLSDWWPGYSAVRPDRRGLAEGARWHVNRTRSPSLLRRASAEGLIVLGRIEPRQALRWRDLEQRADVEITIEPAAERQTLATVRLEAPWSRVVTEGLRRYPEQALVRLHNLCQTAAAL